MTLLTICLHLGPCLNFTFWNNAGVPFILYSSLKPEGYLVTGPKLHLHYVIRDGQVLSLKRIQNHDHDRRRRGNDVDVLSEVSSKGSRCVFLLWGLVFAVVILTDLPKILILLPIGTAFCVNYACFSIHKIYIVHNSLQNSTNTFFMTSFLTWLMNITC